MGSNGSRERLSGVDTAWLRMDRPSNLMMIVGIKVFETPVVARRLREVVETRLLGFDRFRQRIEHDATGACWWVDDDRFDLDAHLLPHRLDGGDAELQAFVAGLAATPLDPARPLWQFHLVHGYRGTDALVARVHHCIGDGIALVRVLLSLTDAEDATAPSAPAARGAAAARRRGARASGATARIDGATAAERGEAPLVPNPWQPLLQPLTAGAVKAIEATGFAVTRSMRLAGEPHQVLDWARLGQRVVSDAARLALMSADTPTCLKGVPGVAKGVAWNDPPLPLEDVKTVCRALGASVNDVLLSCVAGALRRYLRGRGEDTHGCEIRAMVPVNLRPADEPPGLGNRFGLVPLVLPVGIGNPVARLQEVRRRMDELKGGYQAVLAYGLLGAMGWAPKPVQETISDFLAKKATAVMTNVPGPREPLSLAGRRLTRILFWVPQSGDIGLGVSILSYAGGVQFGLIADAGLCPDPQAVVDGFQPEFEQLMLTAAMLPPEMRGAPRLDADALEHALFDLAPDPVAEAA